MTIGNASRVVVLTTLATGVLIISCSDTPATNPVSGAGSGGSAGSGGTAGMTATSGSGTVAGTPSTAGTTAMTAGSGGMGGASAGAGGAGGKAGGGAGGSLGGGGTGGTPPVVVVVPQVCNVSATGKGEGSIGYERWLEVTGNGVAMIPVNEAPDATLTLTELRQGGTGLELFGARIRGFLTAPLAGKYRFWVAGDDNCDVWLGTGEDPASKVRIAWIEGGDNGWTNENEWSKFPSQKSAEITLEADKKYYLEVLHKEGGNLDHVAVAWQLPGESGLMPCEVLPGNVLSPLPGGGEGGAGNGGAGGAQ